MRDKIVPDQESPHCHFIYSANYSKNVLLIMKTNDIYYIVLYHTMLTDSSLNL